MVFYRVSPSPWVPTKAVNLLLLALPSSFLPPLLFPILSSSFPQSRLKKSIKVPPKFLDKNVRRRVRALVEEEAMEKGSPTLGQVVAVLDIKDEDISVGQVDHLDGSVRFEVRYDAVMFRVFVNEVIDGPVTVVHEVRHVGFH